MSKSSELLAGREGAPKGEWLGFWTEALQITICQKQARTLHSSRTHPGLI